MKKVWLIFTILLLIGCDPWDAHDTAQEKMAEKIIQELPEISLNPTRIDSICTKTGNARSFLLTNMVDSVWDLYSNNYKPIVVVWGKMSTNNKIKSFRAEIVDEGAKIDLISTY